MNGTGRYTGLDDVDDIIVGECHYCSGTVVERFAGQLGSSIVRVRRHAEGLAGHEAVTSAEVWAEADEHEHDPY